MKKLLLLAVLLLSLIANAQFWTDKNVAFPSANYQVDKIDIVDANTTWVIGSSGVNEYYSKSVNGGTTWSGGAISLPGGIGSSITSITAVSSLTAWVSAVSNTPSLNGIWKTTNGGATWVEQTTALFNSSYSFINFVHFFNFSDGFCQGDGENGFAEMYTTTNGGTTWVRILNTSIPQHLNYSALSNNYETIGNTIMYVDYGGYFYKSANKGSNWTAIDTPVADGITKCSFTDQNNGVIVSSTGLLYKTINGGLSWNPVTYSGTLFNAGIDYIEGTNKLISVGAVPGSTGSSYSLDNGTSWTTIDNIPKLECKFLNTEIGYASGVTTSANAGGVYKYTGNIFTPPVATTLNENFSGLVLPNGWTTQSLSANICPWVFSNSLGGSTNAGMFLCEATHEWLISPTIDLSSYNDITLSFLPRISSIQAVTNNTHDIKVKISTNGGTTWNQIWSDDNDIIPASYASVSSELFYTTVKRSLAAYCGAGMNNIKIAFQITSVAGTTNSSFRLFNVKVSNDCPVIQPMINTIATGIVGIFSDFENYSIEYGPTGFVQGNGTTVNNITTKSYSIPSLISCTDYQLYMKANCASNSSLWRVYPFTTSNLSTIPLSVPFTENFNSSLCQIGYNASIGNNLSGAIANNELRMISTTASNATINSFVASKQFNLTAGIPIQIKWKNKRLNASFCNFNLIIKDFALATPTNLLSRDNGSSSTSFDENTVSYMPVTSGNHVVNFVINLAAAGVGTIIDDFSISDCFIVATSTVNANSGTINWTGAGTTVDISYGINTAPQGVGSQNYSGLTGTSFGITGLMPCTTYTYYIRTNCGGLPGDWIGYTFTTTITSTTPLSIPFTENFNNSICQIGYTNTLGTIESGPTSNNELKTLSTGSGNNAITRGFNLVAGVPVQIRYRFKKATAGSLFLYTKIGTDINPNNQTEINITNVTAATFALRTINYLPLVTGVHYLSFNCTFTTGTGVIIDDFGVYDCAVVPTNDIITSNTATINWTGTGNSYEIEYGLSGFSLGTGTLVSGITASSYTITGLNSCTDYQYYIRSNCSSGPSFWKAYSFKTQSSAGTPLNVPFSEAYNGNLCTIGYTNPFGTVASGPTVNNELKILNTIAGIGTAGRITTRRVNLSAGVPIQIAWKSKYATSTACNYVVVINDNISNSSAIFNSATNSSSNNSNIIFDNNVVSYLPTTTGQYTLEFYVTGPTNAGIIVDDLVVTSCAVAVSNTVVTPNSAVISWVRTGTTVDISYGINTLIQGVGSSNFSGITANNFAMTNLLPCSKYNFYIRTVCNGVPSEWIYNSFDTTTPTNPLSIPFEENFTQTLCQIGYESNAQFVVSGGSTNSLFTISSGPESIIQTRSFNLTAGVPVQIYFKNRLANNNFGRLRIRVANASNITQYDEIINSFSGTSSTTFVLTSINYIPSTTGTFKIVFILDTSAQLASGDYTGVYIDDFGITNCTAVPSPNPSAVTATSAALSWAGSAASYNLSVTNLDTNITTFVTSIFTNNYTLTGLSSCSKYSIGINANCTIGTTNNFINGIIFTTLSNDYTPSNIPYSVPFDYTNNSSRNICNIKWKLIEGNAAITSVGYLALDGVSAPTTKVLTRGVNLLAGQQYNISYKYKNVIPTTTPFDLKVSIGNSEIFVAQIVLKQYSTSTNNGISSDVYTLENLVFTPTTSGTYYLGLQTTAQSNGGDLCIDDFSITASTLQTTTFDNKSIAVFPNPSTGLVNIESPNDKITQLTITDLAGRIIKTIDGTGTKQQFNIIDLPNAVYFLQIKTTNGTMTQKLIKN